MILTGKEIRKMVELKDITIDPFDDNRVNPNSYNYRLGESYREAVTDEFGNIHMSDMKRIPGNGLLLEPRKLYLANTYEIIGSSKFVTSLIGRSSVGRLGLFVQISADLGNLGGSHKWTLELKCVQPILVYSGMIIGQVSFWKPQGKVELYKGCYNSYDTPHESLINMEDLYDLNRE